MPCTCFCPWDLWGRGNLDSERGKRRCGRKKGRRGSGRRVSGGLIWHGIHLLRWMRMGRGSWGNWKCFPLSFFVLTIIIWWYRPMSLSTHPRVIVNPSSCNRRPILVSSSTHPRVVSLQWRRTTNRSLFVIWLPRRYGRRGTWVACVIIGMGGRQ